MTYLAPLESALPDARAGRKAAALARLSAAGFDTPRAIVLTVAAHTGVRVIAGVTADTTEREAAYAFRDMTWPEPISAAVHTGTTALFADGAREIAIRSSAVDEDDASRSLAGLFHSELHVNSAAAAREAVVRCWASAQRVPGGTKMAVILQQMLYPSWSGVAFSADPVSRDPSQILIEAVPGLANRLCDGEDTPHRFRYDKTTLALRAATPVDSEPPPDPATMAEVARTAAELERIFGSPQDVEWAVRHGSVLVLQSRPITTAVGPASSAPSPGLTALLSEL
jgi:phosphoenolpyruvate synthase/pyruvate phosphate dikinase